MITRGVRSGVLGALLVRIRPLRMSRAVMALLSPFIFPWFQYFKCCYSKHAPLAFGIHNEQYDGDMVII